MTESVLVEKDWKIAQGSTGVMVGVSTLVVFIELLEQLFSATPWDVFRVLNVALFLMAAIFIPMSWFAVRKVCSRLLNVEVSPSSATKEAGTLRASLIPALTFSSGAILFRVMAFSGLLKR